MAVLVVGLNGLGLMPTTERIARKLLKAGKADVFQSKPFTIRLKYKTGSATQDITLGVDTGEQHIGFAVTTENKVLCGEEVKLRKSMEKKEDLITRATYRRGRRYRKVRYRKNKYRVKRKRVYSEVPDKKGRHWHKVKVSTESPRPKGWLAPSIQSKVDHNINWIKKFQRALPLRLKTRIEVARFDVQRMKDPTIHGEMYQRGRMYDYENVKAYVLAKFEYTCPICKNKFDHAHKARLHHITYRSKGATDNPDEYAPICEKCHIPENHKKGGVLDKLRLECERKEYREPAFMNTLRQRLFKAFPDAEFTYGNITNADRKDLYLEKSHINDAIAIALHNSDETEVQLPEVELYHKQVRRKKHSLQEATSRKGRKKANGSSKRNNKNVKERRGFAVRDTVLFEGKIGYITGFSKLAAYVDDFDGNHLRREGKNYRQINLSQLKLVQKRTNNYITKARRIRYE